ncbi:MAG: site-specific integrase [Rhodopseudomonas palustris]|uniref:Site-specific integrase n=1 Tax=Rhodopseudomonas palustris TaxID=1076 RepID=A0A933RX83_RHOPL|nr:site-specific integrase [Rhodopseudomonas palustris]
MTDFALVSKEPYDFPTQGILYDLAGLEVDATGWGWQLNHPVRNLSLNFHQLKIKPGTILSAIAAFLADKIADASPDHVRNTFEALTYIHKCEHIRMCIKTGADVDERVIAELRHMPNFAESRLHYIRDWYLWCADQGLLQFTEQTAERLEELSIPGNPTGEAVRTRDPLKGAFDEFEFTALKTKLNATGREVLTAMEYALLWLAIALGCNPLAYALLREEDFKPMKDVETDHIYPQLHVPRIKKGNTHYRSQSHEKMLNDIVGSAVTSLILANQASREQQQWPEGCAYPLFPRFSIDESRSEGPYREFAMHLRSEEISPILQSAVDKLGVKSHRTGDWLKVNARRFRRTYATRAVEEGVSPMELAVMLDHSDLGTVMVYFETRASQVFRLDAAVAVKLAPLADAFMGRIVRDEAEAVNGDDPSKRIPWYRRHKEKPIEKAGNLGTCGSGPCGLRAPMSCYTCFRFQPWKDGPHREVLDWLCLERERKQEDRLDPQMVKLHDATIFAVAAVVRACEGETT